MLSEKLPALSDIAVAKQSARGSLILFVGYFLATTINALAIIVMARLLGPEGYGAYSLSLLAPGVLILFAGLGVSVAITRYSAYYSSIGKNGQGRKMTTKSTPFLPP